MTPPIKYDMTTVIILLIIGLVAGILSGFVGIGGGIVIVPALIFFLGMSQHMAQGTALALMLPPIGILAVYNYYQKGMVDIKSSLIIGAAFVIGGYFGSKVAVGLEPTTVKRIFGIVVLIVAIKMILSK
jgi:uncharacterized membrane protein YfcA